MKRWWLTGVVWRNSVISYSSNISRKWMWIHRSHSFVHELCVLWCRVGLVLTKAAASDCSMHQSQPLDLVPIHIWFSFLATSNKERLMLIWFLHGSINCWKWNRNRLKRFKWKCSVKTWVKAVVASVAMKQYHFWHDDQQRDWPSVC